MTNIKDPDLQSCPVYVTQAVIDEMQSHGREHTEYEICGVLVGSLCLNADGDWTLVIDSRIEGRFAQHQLGAVTFTGQTWDYIHEQLTERFPHKRIVGWYHTHPDFGIFLSAMDIYIHQNFFSQKWQVAYVYDPIRQQDGWFIWNDQEPVKSDVTILPEISDSASENEIDSLSESTSSKTMNTNNKNDKASAKENPNGSAYSMIWFSFVLLLCVIIFSITQFMDIQRINQQGIILEQIQQENKKNFEFFSQCITVLNQRVERATNRLKEYETGISATVRITPQKTGEASAVEVAPPAAVKQNPANSEPNVSPQNATPPAAETPNAPPQESQTNPQIKSNQP